MGKITLTKTAQIEEVMQAIIWLKENNPYYSDIVIDEEALQRLPDGGVPHNIRPLDVQENEEETERQELAQ